MPPGTDKTDRRSPVAENGVREEVEAGHPNQESPVGKTAVILGAMTETVAPLPAITRIHSKITSCSGGSSSSGNPAKGKGRWLALSVM